jgi:hypothetical protein
MSCGYSLESKLTLSENRTSRASVEASKTPLRESGTKAMIPITKTIGKDFNGLVSLGV